MMNTLIPSILVRILYAATWLWLYATTGADVGLAIIFVITLPLVWLARNDIRISFIDALLLTITALVPITTIALHTPIYASIFGLDKLFHAAGGAAIALLAAVLLRKEIPRDRAFYVTVVLLALAVGAGWEVYEALMIVLNNAAATYYDKVLYLDTILDLVADTAGAVLAMGVWWAWHRTKE